MSDTALKIEGLTKKFGGLVAVNNLDMEIKKERITALIGPNGSGKTTFIKLLCRLYDPTKGHILLNGVDIREYEEAQYRKLFAVVFQDFKIFSFRFGENIAAGEKVDEECDGCHSPCGSDAPI